MLRPHSGQWVFHYPIFLNTYCLAFHLGRLLFHEHNDKERVSKALLRQDHWAEANKEPEKAMVSAFKEDHKVELFIAGQELIANLCDMGKFVEKIPFTSYRLRWVLLHRKKMADQLAIKQRDISVSSYDGLVTFIRTHSVKRLHIITDVGPTAHQFNADLRNRLGSHQVDLCIRDYWTRQEADFYDPTPKLYVLSAPLLSILRKLEPKYCVIDVDDFPPFETYVGAYIRPGTSDSMVSDLTSGISKYFQRVFELAKTADSLDEMPLPPWWLGVGQRYSRTAHSARQPDPFNAQHRSRASGHDDLNYLRLLSQHH